MQALARLALVCIALAGAARAQEPEAPGSDLPAAEPAVARGSGIDPDGRIPRAQRPPDLPNPERWRYIPEGRIPSGNFFQRFLVTSAGLPTVFKSSDAGWGGGIGLGDLDFRNQRRRENIAIYGTYSEEKQQSYGFAWRRWLHQRELAGGGVLQEERSFVQAAASYSRTRTRRFFGIGPDTDHDAETRFTDDNWIVELGSDLAWPDPGDPLVLSGGVALDLHELSAGIGDDPDTKDPVLGFPLLFDEAKHQDVVWARTGIRWDTRDSQRNPYGGFHVGARIEGGALLHGGELVGRYTLDASYTLPVPGLFHEGGDPDEENPSTDTLFVGVRAMLTSGDMPFTLKPDLGGPESLRGFITGRFRDDASWFGRTEYRVWVLERGLGSAPPFRIERIGIAGFYELGSVASEGFELFDARLHHSYGVSFIASIERAFPFRADLGFSKDGMRLTAGLGLSF
jgi:outer membrane protein assembly factor BamA